MRWCFNCALSASGCLCFPSNQLSLFASLELAPYCSKTTASTLRPCMLACTVGKITLQRFHSSHFGGSKKNNTIRLPHIVKDQDRAWRRGPHLTDLSEKVASFGPFRIGYRHLTLFFLRLVNWFCRSDLEPFCLRLNDNLFCFLLHQLVFFFSYSFRPVFFCLPAQLLISAEAIRVSSQSFRNVLGLSPSGQKGSLVNVTKLKRERTHELQLRVRRGLEHWTTHVEKSL